MNCRIYYSQISPFLCMIGYYPVLIRTRDNLPPSKPPLE